MFQTSLSDSNSSKSVTIDSWYSSKFSPST